MRSHILKVAVATALIATLGLAAAASAGPLKVAQQHGGDHPLSPLKWHTTAGVLTHEDPNNTAPKVFVLYFDHLDPNGRVTNVQGTVGDDPFVGTAALLTWDKVTRHAVFDLTATIDLNGLSLPLEGFIHVDYDKLGRVYSIAIDGAINGQPFSVPPMVVTL